MERFQVTQREFSIVLVGTFDPLMMTPHWFVKHGMIPLEDLDENLAIELVYKELTKFSLANVLVEIQPNLLILRSDHASFDYRIQDLAIGILAALKKPNITMLGMNTFEDVLFESSEFWHKIGDSITPKEIWLKASPESSKVGMASVQMQLMKPEGELGVYNFTASWLEAPNAIRFSLNDHFDSKPPRLSTVVAKKDISLRKFDPVAIISAHLHQSIGFYRQVVDSLLNQVEKG